MSRQLYSAQHKSRYVARHYGMQEVPSSPGVLVKLADGFAAIILAVFLHSIRRVPICGVGRAAYKWTAQSAFIGALGPHLQVAIQLVRKPPHGPTLPREHRCLMAKAQQSVSSKALLMWKRRAVYLFLPWKHAALQCSLDTPGFVLAVQTFLSLGTHPEGCESAGGG